MQYHELNAHFRESIRERVEEKLILINKPLGRIVEPGIRDYVVGCIIMLADENKLLRAAERLYEMKKANPETACSLEDALVTMGEVYKNFKTEMSILHDLYQMQESKTDIMDIIAHMEIRLSEEVSI